MDDNVPTVPLVSILYREHAKFLNDKLKDENLSFGLYPLLIKIYKNQGIIQEQLAQSFHLNESTITRNLKKLEDKEFIERIPDKRTKRIEITDNGRKIAQKVMDLDELWDDKIKDIIGLEEYDNFLNTLKKINEGLL
ncbi:MAG: MarR family transcriptional regulator [Methanobrevibacter sp.]|nr:MarR family transcriptional regulator [Methanobrevibacter sp.]